MDYLMDSTFAMRSKKCRKIDYVFTVLPCLVWLLSSLLSGSSTPRLSSKEKKLIFKFKYKLKMKEKNYWKAWVSIPESKELGRRTYQVYTV